MNDEQTIAKVDSQSLKIGIGYWEENPATSNNIEEHYDIDILLNLESQSTLFYDQSI